MPVTWPPRHNGQALWGKLGNTHSWRMIGGPGPETADEALKEPALIRATRVSGGLWLPA